MGWHRLRPRAVGIGFWGALALGPIALSACGARSTIDLPTRGGQSSTATTTSSGRTGGSGGTGGTGGSGGTGGTVPPECEVPASSPAPYDVTFQFHNPSDQTLFLHEQCWTDFTITACADGYAEDLELWARCSVDCADPNGGCIQCEQCLDVAIPIEPGESHLYGWPGVTYTFDTNADGCSCHDDHDQAAGLHRITVPVYLTAEAAELGDVAYEVTIDFPLPAPQGLVVVPVAMLM